MSEFLHIILLTTGILGFIFLCSITACKVIFRIFPFDYWHYESVWYMDEDGYSCEKLIKTKRTWRGSLDAKQFQENVKN